jgi:hypothetical protein
MKTTEIYIKEDELWPCHYIKPVTNRTKKHQTNVPIQLLEEYKKIQEKFLLLNRVLGYLKSGIMSIAMIDLGILNEDESQAVIEADKQDQCVRGIPKALQ